MLGADIFTIVMFSWIDHLIIILSPFVSCNSILKSVLSDCYQYCYFSFLLITTCMKYLFLSSHFQSVCVSRSEMSLL